MEWFKTDTRIDFMRISRSAFVFSIVLSLFSLGFLWHKGLNFGLDFTGGTQLECRFEQVLSLEDIRGTLEASGYAAKVSLFGSSQDVLIRLPNVPTDNEQELGRTISEVLQVMDASFQVRRIEFVGAEVGEDLAYQGAVGMIFAVLATMIYIAFRFEYRFAVSAAVALLHDPILILGMFAITQLTFDLASLAGILAVLGYSLNDTIVIYDRFRENVRKMRRMEARPLMNLAINQTLSRTLMTSMMTLLVVVSLLVLGGESLRGFSAALCVGIVVGTYSSIYVAGALALALGLSRNDLLPAQAKPSDGLP